MQSNITFMIKDTCTCICSKRIKESTTLTTIHKIKSQLESCSTCVAGNGGSHFRGKGRIHAEKGAQILQDLGVRVWVFVQAFLQ